MSRAALADKLKVSLEQLSSWEKRGSPPPFSKAQALAKAVRIPFGFLFLKEAPSLELPLPDFRNFDASYTPSANLRELLNDILVKQDWYRDYMRQQKVSKLKFVGSFSVDDDVTTVAEDIRSVIGLTPAFRASLKTWSDHVTKFAKQVESARILVMRSSVVGNISSRPVSYREMQGFAIADDIAPLVFVNSGDFKAPQVFTLAHEVAHLWIGQSGIDNPDESKPGKGKVEIFCNKVAAEVLMPRAEFLSAWANRTAAVSLEIAVRKFRVSAYAALRRARDLGGLDAEEYDRLKREQAALVKEKAGRGDYFKNVHVRVGSRFSNAVVGEVKSGALTFRDGARLMSVKVPSLLKIAAGGN